MAVAVRLNNVQWTSMLLKPIKGQNLTFQLWQQMKFPRIWKDWWWWSWWPESCVDLWRSHNRNSGAALARRSSTRASWDQSWHWSARSVFLLRSLEAGHWQSNPMRWEWKCFNSVFLVLRTYINNNLWRLFKTVFWAGVTSERKKYFTGSNYFMKRIHFIVMIVIVSSPLKQVECCGNLFDLQCMHLG